MTDRPANLPGFICGGFLWSPYVTDEGQRYEWRSPGFRGRVWRSCRHWHATLDNRTLGRTFETCKSAMQAVTTAARARKAA